MNIYPVSCLESLPAGVKLLATVSPEKAHPEILVSGGRAYLFRYKSTFQTLCETVSILERAASGAVLCRGEYARLVSNLWFVYHHNTPRRASKLAGLSSVSSSALDNGHCECYRAREEFVCSHCYAAAQQKSESALTEHNIINGLILRSLLIPDEYFRFIRPGSFYSRVESFGDVDNVFQARNYIRIIRSQPAVTFGVWSKNLYIWADAFRLEGKPANCVFTASSFRLNDGGAGLPDAFDFVDHIFAVYTPEYLKDHPEIRITCGGRSCMDCIMTGRGCYFPADKDNPVIVREKLKEDPGAVYDAA